jgi:hypothetical protein
MDPMTDDQRLPPDATILREHIAPPGWVAYYFDAAQKLLYAFPMIAWVTVEYEMAFTPDPAVATYEEIEWITTHEIRPFVLARNGMVVDAQEPLQDFLCILGPGFEHLDAVRHLIRKRYTPDDAEHVMLATLN